MQYSDARIISYLTLLYCLQAHKNIISLWQSKLTICKPSLRSQGGQGCFQFHCQTQNRIAKFRLRNSSALTYVAASIQSHFETIYSTKSQKSKITEIAYLDNQAKKSQNIILFFSDEFLSWGGLGVGRGTREKKYKPTQVTNNKAIILTFAGKKKFQFGKQKGIFQTEGHVNNLEKV